MGTAQSREDGQWTKMATVVPRNKDARREDTKIETKEATLQGWNKDPRQVYEFQNRGEHREEWSRHSDSRTRPPGNEGQASGAGWGEVVGMRGGSGRTEHSIRHLGRW